MKRVHTLFRWLDQFLGIPIVFLLGIARRKQNPISTPQRIALLTTAAIGDTILISGIVADLKESYPRASITFFVGPSNREAALLIPGIEVVEITVTNPRLAIGTIRAREFDLWVDCGQWPRINALYSYFARAHFKVGFQTPGQYRHFIYDRAVEHLPIHELENFRNLLRCQGIQTQNKPRLTAPINAIKMDQIVIHMFAGGSKAELRQWADERWGELIDLLTVSGYCIVMTGTKTDLEKCQKIKNACRHPHKIEIIAGQKSLLETAHILIESAALISVNTGIMHLAAVLGCLTIALHGPTSPERWGPVGPHTKLVLPSAIRGPLLHLGFEKVHSNMEFITVEQVWEIFKAAYANRWTNSKAHVTL